jgi:hypothetical protein
MVIHYKDAAGIHETRYLLTERSAELPLAVTGELSWCYANTGEMGFYRQHFDSRLIAGLLAHLGDLEPAEQLGLLRDQWALVSDGSQPIGTFLDLLDVVARSDDYRIVRQVTIHLGVIEGLLVDGGSESTLEAFRRWVARIFGPKLAVLGYEPRMGETEEQAQTRCFVLDAMTRYSHDPAAIEQARVAQERESEDPRASDANLAPIFIGAAAQFGDDALQQRYLRIYQERKAADASPQEIERYVGSFPRFDHPQMVQRTLEWIDAGIFPFQHIMTLVAMMTARRRTQVAVWSWIKTHWDFIEHDAAPLLPRIVQATGQLPAELRPDLVAFYDEHLHGELQASVAQALEHIDQTAELKARTHDGLLAWFNRS